MTQLPHFTLLPNGKFGIVIPHDPLDLEHQSGLHTGRWITVKKKDGNLVTRKVGAYLTSTIDAEIYRFDNSKCPFPGCGKWHDDEAPPEYADWCKEHRIAVQDMEEQAAEAGNLDPWNVLTPNTPPEEDDYEP